MMRPIPKLAASLPLLIGGCAGIGAVVPIAMKLGKSLLGAATENYSPAYGQALDELITAMVTPPAPIAIAPSASARPSGKALALEVAILEEDTSGGKTNLVAIEDGAVLHDGGGDPARADKFKISFRSDQSCYVYVLAIDGTGWVTPVFPGQESAGSNPVEPGRTYLIPEGSRWYALDEYRGIEHVYLVASVEQRADLERMQAKFAQMVRPEKTEYRRVDKAAVATRGIVAVGPGTPTHVASETGEVHEVTPTSFLADLKGFDLVVTRWFEHQ